MGQGEGGGKRESWRAEAGYCVWEVSAWAPGGERGRDGVRVCEWYLGKDAGTYDGIARLVGEAEDDVHVRREGVGGPEGLWEDFIGARHGCCCCCGLWVLVL